MISGVTRLGGLSGLPGRVTLSAGVTICPVNVSRWGNPPSWGRFHEKKALKRNTYVLKLCTFLNRLMKEITRNRNGHTRSVKRSHFGIFSVANRPYFKLFLITHQVNSSSRNLTQRNTARDAFMDKYI